MQELIGPSQSRSTNVKRFGITNELSNYFDVRFYDNSDAAIDSAFSLVLDPDYG